MTLAALALAVAGCGGDDDSGDTGSGKAAESQRAAALSLQQAMDASASAIDDVRGTRDSLERLGLSLEPQVAQTGDVIALLTPKATGEELDRLLLAAARDQRSFLQLAVNATEARSSRAAASAITRARAAGRRATTAYASIAQQSTDLAGLLPSSTTFSVSRLRDALAAATKTTTTKSDDSKSDDSKSDDSTSGGTTGGTTGGTGTTDCGDGLSVNSVTSCTFARNVRDTYRDSGGANVIDVYSPVTKIVYTMTCTDGVPVVCRGGNGAAVYIR